MRRNPNKATAALPKLMLMALALGSLVVLVACSKSGSTAENDKIQVVATTNIVADWVENIGGDRVEVFSLVPAGADPHSYQPGAKDVARVADAQLVLSVGLDLEGSWLEELLQNAARAPSNIVTLGDGLDPIEFEEEEGEEEEEGGEEHHGEFDPHFWFDPLRVKLAVDDIAARLSALDPARADTFSANAASYKAELEELHGWTIQQFINLPEERRVLVTSHDSFQYFAQVYGFEVVGTVLSAGTTEVEPSAEHLASLVELVRDYSVPAIFGETTVSERLATSIVTETGAELVRLHSGSLGIEGSGAETFIEMIRTNVGRIAAALK